MFFGDNVWHFDITDLNGSLLFWLLFFGCFLLFFCCFLGLLSLLFQSRLHLFLGFRTHKSLNHTVFGLGCIFFLLVDIFQWLDLISGLLFNHFVFLYFFLFFFIWLNGHDLSDMLPAIDIFALDVFSDCIVAAVFEFLLGVDAKIMSFDCLLCRPLLENSS